MWKTAGRVQGRRLKGKRMQLMRMILLWRHWKLEMLRLHVRVILLMGQMSYVGLGEKLGSRDALSTIG